MTMRTTSFNAPVFPTNLIYYLPATAATAAPALHRGDLAQRQQQPHRQHRYNIGGDHSPLDYYIILVAGISNVAGIGTTLGTNTAPWIILHLLEAGISGNNSAGTGIGTTLGATTAPWITILFYSSGGRHHRQQQLHHRRQYNIGGDHSPLNYYIILFFWRPASPATTTASPASIQYWVTTAP